MHSSAIRVITVARRHRQRGLISGHRPREYPPRVPEIRGSCSHNYTREPRRYDAVHSPAPRGVSSSEEVSVRTADQYLESLRGRDVELWVDGERVTDPVDHPKLRPAINAVAATYALAEDPDRRHLAIA